MWYKLNKYENTSLGGTDTLLWDSAFIGYVIMQILLQCHSLCIHGILSRLAQVSFWLILAWIPLGDSDWATAMKKHENRSTLSHFLHSRNSYSISAATRRWNGFPEKMHFDSRLEHQLMPANISQSKMFQFEAVKAKRINGFLWDKQLFSWWESNHTHPHIRKRRFSETEGR